MSLPPRNPDAGILSPRQWNGPAKCKEEILRKKALRMLSEVSGSRRNPLKPIFVVQTSQDGLGQNSMVARNSVSGESRHRAVLRRFWYPWPQAGEQELVFQ